MSAVTKPAPQSEVVITKAMLRAADRLSLNKTQLARILGVNPGTVSRYDAGTSKLRSTSGEWDCAAALIRVYRSLAGLLDGNDALIKSWMTSHNYDFDCAPITMLERHRAGVYNLGAYLDAYRGRF